MIVALPEHGVGRVAVIPPYDWIDCDARRLHLALGVDIVGFAAVIATPQSAFIRGSRAQNLVIRRSCS